MDMNRIGIILNEIYKYKNHKDFVNLLSFEERIYIFNNLLSIADTYSLFNVDEILYNFFKEEEVNSLYEHISELDDLQKGILAMNAHENLKKEIIKQINDTYTKAELILSLENDDDKLELADSISNEGTKTSIISSLKNPNYKLEYIKKIGLESITFIESLINSIKEDDVLIELLNFINEKFPDIGALKYEVIKNFSSDELKLKYLNTLSDYTLFSNDVFKLYIAKTLNDDIKKIEIIKNIKIDENIELNNALVDVIKSLNSDNLKLENLYLLGDNSYLIAFVLMSLKSPELKLKNMHLAKDNAANVLASIDDDDIKLANLHLLKENYGTVIKSINNPEKRFKLISDNINKIPIFLLVHMDDLDKVKTIYPNIITAVSNYYQINKNNLTKIIEKYGYNTFKFLGNKNIVDLLELNEEDFNKIIKIFDTQKAHQLNMVDVDNIIGTLLQREFRFSNKDVISIFPMLENLIEAKNVNEIGKILKMIQNNFNIDEILIKYNLNYNNFINGLIEGKTEHKNILHEITDKYISLKRDEYLLQNNEKIKKELNLEKAYEKNYLLDKMFTYFNVDKIYNLIINIDKSNLNKEQIELINNEELLKECIIFRQNPKEYKGSNVKSKIKLLNQILSELYLSKEINYLGDNDLNAKLIFNTKNIDAESILKIMSEIDVEVLKNKTLNNSEIYEKLLKVMSTYHFLGWNDMFEVLLAKADLVFDDSSIGTFINYFYDFYPKLEEKVRTGKLKNISLTTLIDEISVYGSSSVKYKYLLGQEDYRIFITNAGPNAAYLPKEERLKKLPEKIKGAFTRQYITVPPLNKNIKINNKVLNVRVGNVTDSINFTYGERTGACMRIGGPGDTLFDFCLLNENGFHVSLNDPNTNQFVSRVSGFRNGNTVFLNQLRSSVSDKYSDQDLYEAIKAFSNLIVELTKDSDFPIKNVVISNGFAMNNHTKENENLSVNPKDGFEYFYSDVSKDNAIFLIKTDEIKLGPSNTEKYDLTRKKINYYTEYDDIKNALQQIKLFDGLIKEQELFDIELYQEDVIEQISKLYVGEDWFIALDKNNEIIAEHIIERNSKATTKAKEEISKVLENINLLNNTYEVRENIR